MLEVEPTGQRDRIRQPGVPKNGNEAVVGAASEAFARWLHHQYAPSKCHVVRRGTPLLQRALTATSCYANPSCPSPSRPNHPSRQREGTNPSQ